MCRTCGKRHNSYEFNPGSGTLQDVSLESSGSLPFPFGPRSPGKFLPLRGRNMKEYDEQLTHLKNENFSLKLRVYFLEERLGQKEISEEKEDLIKANMEFKVQNEALKKELLEKQELVRQASALLSNLEAQYKEQVIQIKKEANTEKDDLQRRIKALEQELLDHCDNCRSISGDLNQLCGLAFDGSLDGFPSEEGQMSPSQSLLTSPMKTFGSSPMQGVFSIMDDPSMSSIDSAQNPLGKYEQDMASKRIKELEETVDQLQYKVSTLQEELEDKRKHSEALEEDVYNLKKEIEEQEEKLTDLEAEVTEKEEKVDQLMQDLETRHLEIKAKDSTIQNLHDDLTKVEPEIEIKVQEIVERDRIIEEKLEQLQQQNKILVEIQITLDEKQKLIAELEENLRRVSADLESKSKELQQTTEKTKILNEKIATLEKENHGTKKEIGKKDKKIKDLTAQLKESLDMLQKASWEAETRCRGNDVREMADDEHDGLWAELEQRKAELKTLQASKEEALGNAQKRIEDLKDRAEKAEKLLSSLQIQSNPSVKPDSERDKALLKLEGEIRLLREESKSREDMLAQQQTKMASLQMDLERTRDDLNERKLELKDLKQELTKKNNAIQEFITNELLGRREELKDLHGKFLGNRDTSQDELRRVLESLNLSAKAKRNRKVPIMAQLRSNSLSEIEDPPTKGKKEDKNKAHSPRPGRSSSFSTLENALFAHMGQKVYNTNQTFNTYVIPGPNEEDKGSETQEGHPDARSALPEAPVVLPYPETSTPIHEPEDLETTGPTTDNVSIKMLYEEMSRIRGETQALRQEREILNDKLDSLQSLSNRSSRHGSAEKEETQTSIASVSNQMQHDENNSPYKEKEYKSMIIAYEKKITSLKDSMQHQKQRITFQLLNMASNKHHDVLKTYKQEIASLRKRLADSHNACDLMRTKLEELIEYLELLVTPSLADIRKPKISPAALARTINDARELSHSLSQSLMIGSEENVNSIDKSSSHLLLSMEDIKEVDLMVPLLEAQSKTDNDNTYKNVKFCESINSCAFTYEDVARALHSGNSNQDTTVELKKMSDTIHEKEALLKEKDESISSLQKKMEHLQTLVTSEKLTEAQLTSSEQKDQNMTFKTSVPGMSLIDSRLYDNGVLIYPDEIQSSATSDPILEYASLAASITTSQKCVDQTSVNGSQPQAKSETLVLASPSESEAWSEPDRNVSLARIGLETCVAAPGGTERPTSKCRTNRETPLSSESDIEINVEEDHGGVQAGLTTKHKRRSDATEVKRLTSKLRGVEQVNETLKAELHIYQTLTQHFNSLGIDKPKPSVSDKSVDTEISILSMEESEDLMNTSKPILQEIQSLRMKLEEAIVNNDLLRDQLEAALAGYLSEETKNLTSNLVSAETNVKALRGQLAICHSDIEQLKLNLDSKDRKLSEIEQSASFCHSKNQELIETSNKLRQELKIVQATLVAKEDDLCALKSIQSLEEENLNMKSMKIKEREAEVKSLKVDLEISRGSALTKDKELDNLSAKISDLELLKDSLEQKISEQKEKISRQTEIIEKYEERVVSNISETTIKTLKETLSKSEDRCVQMTKEHFAMVAERSRMQSQLSSAIAKIDQLQNEIICISESEDSCFSDTSHDILIERFRSSTIEAQKEQKRLLIENQSLRKELCTMQEDLSSLRAHLTVYHSKDSVPTSKCLKDISSLQASSKLVQSQLTSLKNANLALQLEKDSLEIKLAQRSSSESLRNDSEKQRKLEHQLESERKLSRSLIRELDALKSLATKELADVSSNLSSPLNTSLDFLHSSPKLVKPSPSKTSQFPSRYSSQRSSSFTPGNTIQRENYLSQYMPSCGSPDLGIGSDGHFSSLEAHEKARRKRILSRNQMSEDCVKLSETNRLCSDPSHMHLVRERKVLLQEKEQLNDHLTSTKDTLQQALEELVHVNKRKETIENAIDRQLSRTTEVLRSSSTVSPMYTPNMS